MPDALDIDNVIVEYRSKGPNEVIKWALDTFGDRIAICTSFQSEGMVILDIAHSIQPDVKVFTIDTGRLPQETHDLIDKVRAKYQIQVDVHHPDPDELRQFVTKHGINPFYESVSLRLGCCEIRKTHTLDKALVDFDAWITGLRRSQTRARGAVEKIEIDVAHNGMIKINPLANWSREQVAQYIKSHDVPQNELYNQGYTSIGCVPCTRPVKSGEDVRAGRWWWEKGVPKECGIHMNPAWVKAVAEDLNAVKDTNDL